MYRRFILHSTCLTLAILLTSPAHADNQVKKLLAKVFETYGGVEVIAHTTNIQQRGKTFSSMRGAEGDIVRMLYHPDHLKVEIKYPSGSESRVLAGDTAWKQGKKTTGPFRLAMLLQAGRIWLPRTLYDHQGEVTYTGSVKAEDGSQREFLDIPLGKGMTISVEIESQSGRILTSRGTLEMGGMAMVFGTDYADFRMQDGRLFAFKETHYAMGRPTGHTQIEKLEFPIVAKEGQILL